MDGGLALSCESRGSCCDSLGVIMLPFMAIGIDSIHSDSRSSADGLINGKGKFEQLIVAAQEIGASVAQ